MALTDNGLFLKQGKWLDRKMQTKKAFIAALFRVVQHTFFFKINK